MLLKLERKDGTVLSCKTMPLPDGATMLTFQDISDTENVERALRERNEALETADRIKIDFVHHVSYELRSPLTTIIGFAHLLSDPSTGPLTDKQSEYIAYITSSTNALLAIINNILDLASIDAGAMTLNLGPIDIRRSHRRGGRRHSGSSRARSDQRSTSTTDPAIDQFIGDERRVVQVLYNLLANAIGFSPQPGHGEARRPQERRQGRVHRDRCRAGNCARAEGQGVRSGSRATLRARGTAAPASAWRWCVPSSNCTAARSRSIRWSGAAPR